MIYRAARYSRGPGMGGPGGFLGAGGPPPRDLLVVLGVIFVTFSMQFFEATAIVPALLRLSPAVYRGLLWQLVTYPFVGFGRAGLWFLLELLILFWFGRDVYRRLGRRRFWTLVLQAAGGAAVVAVLVQLLVQAGGGTPDWTAFQLMQGQRMLLTILIAAFATMYGEATILLFFVLPIRARWFLGLEILFAFLGFLNTKDLAGFLGICAAVAITFMVLTPGGPRQVLWKWRREAERLLLQARLARMRKRRRFDVIDGDDRGNGDRWVH